jgi:lipopolysaccharide export system permease protein
VVVQFIYQRLAGDREITVMRTAGLSPIALSRPAIALAVIAMACCYVLNLWIVPASLGAFREYQWEIRNRMVAFLLQEGVFTSISDNLTVYVRTRDPDGTLHGILVDDARDKTAHATILSERGRLIEGPNGPRVLLIDGSREEIDHQTGRLNVLTFSQNEIDLSDTNNNTGPRVPDMSEMSVRQLLSPHPANPHDASKWIAEGNKRLASPLSSLSYAFVALLSVLTGAFRRHGSMLRPLVAIGAMVALLAAGFAVENLAAGNSALVPLMWLQATVPGFVCAWLLLGPQLIDRYRFRLNPA